MAGTNILGSHADELLRDGVLAVSASGWLMLFFAVVLDAALIVRRVMEKKENGRIER